MKYILLLLLVSCASTQYKRHSFGTVKYTVREHYLPINTVKPEAVKPKPKKTIKKAKKPNCEAVYKAVNQCMGAK